MCVCICLAPFALRAALTLHLNKQTAVDFKENFDQNTVEIFNNCFDVDDCLAFSLSVKEAKRLLKEVPNL